MLLRYPLWKIAIVLSALFLGVALCVPNFFSEEYRKQHLAWYPTGALNLGLDLKGGASILLEVDPEELRTNELRNNVSPPWDPTEKGLYVDYPPWPTRSRGRNVYRFTLRPTRERDLVANVKEELAVLAVQHQNAPENEVRRR